MIRKAPGIPMRCVLAITPPTRHHFNLAYCTPLYVSLSFGQVFLYWIKHHRAQLLTDLQCDVAACEAERGPAPRRYPGKLHWPAHLIGKLWPVGAKFCLSVTAGITAEAAAEAAK